MQNRKLVIFIVFVGLFFLGTGCSPKIWIKTGRPQPFVIRNAQIIIGKKYHILYQYQAYKSDAQLDSINVINKKTRIWMKNKYGTDAMDKIKNEIYDEADRLSAMKSWLLEQNKIKSINLLVFVKEKDGIYQAKVYPAIEPENRTTENLLTTIRLRYTNQAIQMIK